MPACKAVLAWESEPAFRGGHLLAPGPQQPFCLSGLCGAPRLQERSAAEKNPAALGRDGDSAAWAQTFYSKLDVYYLMTSTFQDKHKAEKPAEEKTWAFAACVTVCADRGSVCHNRHSAYPLCSDSTCFSRRQIEEMIFLTMSNLSVACRCQTECKAVKSGSASHVQQLLVET